MSKQTTALLEASIKQHCKVLRTPAIASQFVSSPSRPSKRIKVITAISRRCWPPRLKNANGTRWNECGAVTIQLSAAANSHSGIV
jgi:hypothetical protein